MKFCISGEDAGYCRRYLTDYEYELIKDIFDECDSKYCGGSIYLVEDNTDKKCETNNKLTVKSC